VQGDAEHEKVDVSNYFFWRDSLDHFAQVWVFSSRGTDLMFSWWFLGALRVPASRKVTAVLGKTLFILGILFSKQLCFLNDAISLFS